MSENKEKKRIVGLDIIRCLAILFVFVIHQISYKGVMDANILSPKWTIYLIIRFLSMSCVPLFLMLTGYLNNKKEISKNYYKGIIPLIFSYVVISVCGGIGYDIYTNTPINALDLFVNTLNFTQNDYAWYFEMYIGLFLMIPFLNILYDNLKSKKEKIILVTSLGFLTLVPPIVKSFMYNGAWLSITPDFFQIMYPITYFFIGKLIKEYKPSLSISKKLICLIISLAIPSIFCYVASLNGEYAWHMFNGFDTLTSAFIATSVFLIFYDFDKKIPVIGKLIEGISICSFEMYLLSEISDKYFASVHSECNIIMALLFTFVTTFIGANIIILIRNFIFKLVAKLYKFNI